MTSAIPMRALGRSGLAVTELGFGAAPLGNLYQPVEDDAARATVAAVLDAGIRYIDTAPYYGLGLSERRIGDTLRGRDDVVVSSKVGRLLVPDIAVRDDRERHGFRSAMPFAPVYDYRYDGVMRSFEASLQRMGLARIDMLYVHDIGRLTHGADHDRTLRQLVAEGGLRALEALRAGGAIGGFGIGVNEIAICLEVMAEARLDAILLAGRYTLLEQAALDVLLPACTAAETSIVVGGPYNSGILATGTRSGSIGQYDYAAAPPEIVARVAAIEEVAGRHHVPLAAAALQFPLAHPAVASVIPGLGDPARVAQTMALYRTAIPESFWAELKQCGLLRGDAPVPAARAG